jgi:hypothetical protein
MNNTKILKDIMAINAIAMPPVSPTAAIAKTIKNKADSNIFPI